MIIIILQDLTTTFFRPRMSFVEIHHNKGNKMNKQTPQKPVLKTAIALAVMIVGGFSIYAGVTVDEKIDAQASNADRVTSKKMPSSAPVTAQAVAQSGPAVELVAQGQTSYNATKINTQFSPDTHNFSMPTAAPKRMSEEMMAQMELPASFVPNSAEGSTEGAPFSRINLKEFSSGEKAIALLGNDLDAVAKWYGMSSDAMRDLLVSDDTVHLDRKGRILHIDAGLESAVPAGAAAGSSMQQATTATTAAAATSASPFPLDQTFKLHTKPNSTRILYLNFTGDAANPAFSLDATPATYNDAERILIQKVWQRVVEDYAPFDVDVTTEKPAAPAGKVGMTVLITPRTHTAGGYAYLNSFGAFSTGTASTFCFPNNLANSEKPIAECVSHELGHTLGLSHQGTTSVAYYQGQGDGETGWAPIMGVGYYKNLTQWSKGEYANANNKEDAYAVMLKQGLKPLADDHGNTITTADAMLSKSANGYNNLSVSGVIGTPGDVDMFSFIAGAGTASFTVKGADLGGNLDVALQLLDSKGKVLASANADATLGSTISFALPAQGMYFLSVTGAGKGSATVSGYSNYGSLGQYSITGTSALSNGAPVTPPPTTVTPPAPVTPPPVTPPKPVTPAADARNVTVTFDARGASVAGATIKTYLWNFGDGTATASTALAIHTYTKVGTYTASLSVIDSLGRKFGTSMQVVIK
ncbi:PKD domain-containing protein [Undibacterium parvum]|uniref:PKD domain-containing protein n=2 Tax=Undibacterium parvum TaxID=401471 RepID=A0A3Q9BNP5_9BURK|nr:PKD domain-containing protein [Undibacterium parvum]